MMVYRRETSPSPPPQKWDLKTFILGSENSVSVVFGRPLRENEEIFWEN